MRTIDNLLKAYGKSHQNKMNKIIHLVIVVPLFLLSVSGFLMSIPLYTYNKTLFINLAFPALLFLSIYYLKLSKALFFSFLVLVLILLFGNYYIYVWNGYCNVGLAQVSFYIFCTACVFQFIGYKMEGIKPSISDFLKFLIIGPAWLLHFLFKFFLDKVLIYE